LKINAFSLAYFRKKSYLCSVDEGKFLKECGGKIVGARGNKFDSTLEKKTSETNRVYSYIFLN
jgi:hypothetical protein